MSHFVMLSCAILYFSFRLNFEGFRFRIVTSILLFVYPPSWFQNKRFRIDGNEGDEYKLMIGG